MKFLKASLTNPPTKRPVSQDAITSKKNSSCFELFRVSTGTMLQHCKRLQNQESHNLSQRTKWTGPKAKNYI